MATVIIPVLLCFFLGPGVGQLYNKEYKKGAILIVLSAIVLIGAGIWYYKAMQPFIPSDLTAVDPTAMQELMTNAASQVSSKEGHLMFLSEGILMVLWLYGVVDAYLIASRRRSSNRHPGESRGLS